MKLSTKLSLTMATQILLLCILGVFNLIQFSHYNDATEEIAEVWLPSTRYAQDIYAKALDFRTNEILYIVAQVPERKARYQANVNTLVKELSEDFEKYRSVISTQQEKDIWQAFLAHWKEYEAFHDRMFKLSDTNRVEEAQEMLRAESVSVFRTALADLDALVDVNVKGSEMAKDECDALYSSAKTIVTVLLVVSVIIAVALCLLILKNVSSQLGKDPGDLQAIALKVVGGDYNVDDGSPKIGVFGSIVEMVSALKEHIEEARKATAQAERHSQQATAALKSAEEASQEAQEKTRTLLSTAEQLENVGNVVSSATTQLSAQVEQSNVSLNEAALHLSEAATAMNEMNATVQEVARNAASASATSNETKQKAEAGSTVVEKAVSSIDHIHDRAMRLKEDMNELNGHAQNISRIMNVISDIADQTNLLALNAAIEAARAGDAGRGFAVVADEVRKLAEKTMNSTNDVGNAIKAIQDSTAQSLASMDETVNKLGETTILANESGVALREIVAMVESTSDQINAIATASEEQSAASDEINRTISEVNTMSKQTVAAMGEATKAISDVVDQTHTLTGLIHQLQA